MRRQPVQLRTHLDEAHISVAKLLIEHLVVLFPHGLDCLLVVLKVHERLQQTEAAAAGNSTEDSWHVGMMFAGGGVHLLQAAANYLLNLS